MVFVAFGDACQRETAARDAVFSSRAPGTLSGHGEDGGAAPLDVPSAGRRAARVRTPGRSLETSSYGCLDESRHGDLRIYQTVQFLRIWRASGGSQYRYTWNTGVRGCGCLGGTELSDPGGATGNGDTYPPPGVSGVARPTSSLQTEVISLDREG